MLNKNCLIENRLSDPWNEMNMYGRHILASVGESEFTISTNFVYKFL